MSEQNDFGMSTIQQTADEVSSLQTRRCTAANLALKFHEMAGTIAETAAALAATGDAGMLDAMYNGADAAAKKWQQKHAELSALLEITLAEFGDQYTAVMDTMADIRG